MLCDHSSEAKAARRGVAGVTASSFSPRANPGVAGGITTHSLITLHPSSFTLEQGPNKFQA